MVYHGRGIQRTMDTHAARSGRGEANRPRLFSPLTSSPNPERMECVLENALIPDPLREVVSMVF